MPGSGEHRSVGEPLTIDPPAAAWAGLVAARAAPAFAREFREELGLPTGRPLIMTGHQAAFWHPGILAKFIAGSSAAEALGGEAAWVVVDQADPPVDTIVRYPARLNGALEEQRWDVAAGPPAPAGIDYVDEGLRRIWSAWRSAAPEGAPVRRVSAALSALLAPFAGRSPAVFASGLARTGIFQRVVERMRQDPLPCVRAHNHASRAHPSAGIRPLVFDEVQERFELPLWHLTPGGRRRVYAESLEQIPLEQLAPRAVLLTGVLRLAGCDLFVHGTGGGGGGEHEGYDRVTEDWLAAWGRSDAAIGELMRAGLAPVAVITATRLLPLVPGGVPAAQELARARWLAHRAAHDPALLRDPEAAGAKRELVSAIAAAPRRSRERAELFRRLHESLERVRGAHAEDLAALRDRAAEAAVRRADGALAADRTWPFPLYPDEILRDLRGQIRGAFGRPA